MDFNDIWNKIDDRLYRSEYAHPNIRNRIRLDRELQEGAGHRTEKILICADYQHHKPTNDALIRLLKKLGYDNAFFSEEPNRHNYLYKLMHIIFAERYQDVDIIANVDCDFGLKNRMLLLLRKIKYRCKTYVLADNLYKDKVDTIPCPRYWHMYFQLHYREIYNDIKVFESLSEYNERVYYAKRIFIDFYYIKDFINAEKYIEILKGICKSKEEYIEFLDIWKEISGTLELMKESIDASESIVVNWIDALRYDEYEWLPWVAKEAKKGIFYENMYANTPYTWGTLRSIFFADDLIEGKLYRISNKESADGLLRDSALMHTLADAGYEFFGISNHFNQRLLQNELIETENVLIPYMIPSTMLQFESVKYLAECRGKAFLLIHNWSETHPPNENPLSCEIVGMSGLAPYSERIRILPQAKISAKYLDEQLEYYARFYNDSAYRVYFSDHGWEREKGVPPIEETHHVFFAIIANRGYTERIKDECSLKRFDDIVKILIRGDLDDLHECREEYALVQHDDTYGLPKDVFVKGGLDLYKYLQYRGCINRDEAYIRYACGWEYYCRHGKLIPNSDVHKYKERIDALRQKAGDIWIDIYSEDKYERGREFYSYFGLEMKVNNFGNL